MMNGRFETTTTQRIYKKEMFYITQEEQNMSSLHPLHLLDRAKLSDFECCL